MIKNAIDKRVPVLATALYARFASCDAADFQGKLVWATPSGFCGNLEKPAK